MLLSNLPRPAIFAHRGASAFAPENTLAAFKLALQQEADGIELDAKLSADGHVVVIHDQRIDRTTPLKGRVNKYIMADLHKMDAGSHFDVAFKGEPIPSLEEVFKAVGQLTYLNIELTNYYSPLDELPFRVAELVRHHRLQHRVIFSSFNLVALLRIHRLIPEAPIGLLISKGWPGGLTRSISGRFVHYDSLHSAFEDATPGLIQALHRKERKVFAYTVNRENDLKNLFETEVDGVFTDNPKLARDVLERMRRSIR
jgi:glycerophosphoryl diester phosphodiesterase